MSADQLVKGSRAALVAARPAGGPVRPRVLVVGARPGAVIDALVGELTDVVDLVDLLPNPEDVSVELAIGVAAPGDPWQRSFDRWAADAGVPALGIEVSDQLAVIGPLALPGRPGCGECARQRRLAASAALGPARPGARTPQATPVAQTVVAVVAAAVRDILRDGANRSDLVDHLLDVDPYTVDFVRHRVIPLPRCDVCGGAITGPTTRPAGAELPVDGSAAELLESLSGWVDPLTGVIPWIALDQPLGAGLPSVATAAPPHVIDRTGTPRRLPIGWGKGTTVSRAIVSAVGEVVERYAASLPDPDRLRWARLAELDGDLLHPRAFPLYDEQQYRTENFPYVPFDPGIRHPWVLGSRLGTGRPVWVPAVLVYLSLTLHPEQLVCQGTSNGLAAGTDVDSAAVRATLELLERDAFMTAWLTGTVGCRVDLDDTLDPALYATIETIEGLGPAVELYLLPTSRCGTTACALALGDGERWPAVALGLGTDLDARRAIAQAVLELAQTLPHLARLLRSAALPIPPHARAVRQMLDHAAYYFPAHRAAAFDRLRRGGETIMLSEVGEPHTPAVSRPALAALLDGAGIDVVLVDVTSPDVATGPFRVVRALSPDLQPISYGFGNDPQPVPSVQARGLDPRRPPIHPIW